MSETKTTCRYCGRPPGGIHGGACRLGKRYARRAGWKPPPKLSYGYPIANVFDLVGGDIKVIPIERGTPHCVNLSPRIGGYCVKAGR